MLRRFVAASMVASVVIAIGAIAVLIIPGLEQRAYPLIVLWCFIPCIWGLWAMIAPAHWVPDQLPYWGAGLGFLAAFVILFAVELPQRLFGIPLSMELQALSVLIAALFYYVLWTIVEVTYKHLHHIEKTHNIPIISAGGRH